MRAESLSGTRLLYNLRFRAILYQVLAVGSIVLLGLYLFSNVSQKLEEQNIATGFAFLGREAGFVISQTLIDYKPTDTYGRAILAGIVNTIWVSAWSVVLATIIGLFVGIARLSRNPLLSLLAFLYVEALRNVPLLLYLFLWYALIVTGLPGVREAWEILPHVFLSNSGLTVPALTWTGAHSIVLVALALGGALALAVHRRATAERIRTGRDKTTWPLVALALLLPPVVAILVVQPELTISIPEKGRFRLTGGAQLRPEFTALLVGLALSASAGIAEIVRSGILSVRKGQWEAARALGLKDGLTMRLVVLPQALRVIIPPLTSSYLSLFKNSSLAIAIGYPDLVMVSNTTMNQTGQAIEGIAIFMLVYLGLSIAISLFMNWYNSRVALKER
ncbi:amino acid ABC transporter permease [Microvirga arsenatis]|uniref:ABC transporter permease subunit n=1 Tax=Microvirga arsenatis TaxID=2692265 RepID=A0ABW9YYW5_9HYPH|nr:ABC transporter permease subunit [Microvirga arsenatis]NBJ11122.1 ABC transporter permease subunit [Microvirga arsenatis]NBJ25395.1 ABC transporter permease subunit [Microvirga arsenatis]